MHPRRPKLCICDVLDQRTSTRTYVLLCTCSQTCRRLKGTASKCATNLDDQNFHIILVTLCPILHIESKKSPAGFRSYLHLVIHEYTLKSHLFPNFNDLIKKKSSFTIFIHKILMRRKLSKEKSPQCYGL